MPLLRTTTLSMSSPSSRDRSQIAPSRSSMACASRSAASVSEK